ncbi:hypothetical protein [Aeromonas phage AS-yj]|uniref:Uncharacterized protein n=3 Tax=Ceceduovirus TaxID=2842588 RepID=I6XH15_9CAUD|nr:hypothetical protein F485_gp175 [Aeromonas phage CC2]YP_009834464.1 hypothetical protein HWB28_gp164 [Aeromonas phage AS-zj]AFN39351.1 hypothetical protein CC2_120 [Aeromonas phage CC2]ASU00388.1 hypothetical protein [Aeromonas phage AS-zj]ATI17899.1 hypothetical protein [Aeromonas phage AS-yj]
MFALAHKETGKFVGWEVFTSHIDGETDYCLTEPEFSNNVWCLLAYMDVKRILERGEIKRGINTFYSDPDVDFSLDEYEIVVLTGVKV